MGQEIVYCHNCKSRLTGKEFEQGKAFRIENNTICLECARKELAALPPAERDAYAAMMKSQVPKKTSTQRIPLAKPPDPSSTARLRALEPGSSTRLRMAQAAPSGEEPREGEAPKRSRTLLLGLAGGGIVLVALVLLLVVLLSGRRPPTMIVEPGPATGGPSAPGDARLKEAQGLLDQARAFQKANPDDFVRQLDLFGKAAWAGSGTPVADQAKQEMALIQIRRAEKMAADLAQLDARVKPLLERGDWDGATRLVDEARNRYSEPDWLAGIRKITEEVDRLRNAAPVVVTPDPVPEVPMPVAAWSVLDPDEWKSTGGSALRKLDDRSILAPRAGPDMDVYTVTARSDLRGITAFRLEALPDNSLPARGPGRADNGNFVLTEFKAELGGRALAFKGSSSSYEQSGWPSSAAVDGDPTTGWAIMPRAGRNLEAVFHLQDPADGGTFVFTLEFLSAANPRHVLGRFRISATSAKLPDPPPPRRTEKSSAPVSPAARAYRERWKPAALLAAARDYEAAVRAFEQAKASLPDAAFKAEAEGDLADLKLAASLWAEVKALLLKWPAGRNLPAEILAADGRRVRVDEPVRRSEGLLFEIRPSPEARALSAGEILAGSLADLFLEARGKPSDADRRAAGVFCALEGDAEAARRHLGGGFSGKLEEHALQLSMAGAGPEAEARRKLREAVDGFFAPGTRAASLERFAALRRDHGDALAVRRSGSALEAGPDALAEYVYAAADLKASGSFSLLPLPKGEIAWVMGEDVPDRERRREHAVEAEYSAAANSEYRAWVLAGACCQETFAFYVQGNDLEVPGETTGIPVRCDPDSAVMAPVAHGLSGLKKTHASHGGPKAPARFEWIALPVLKHPGGGAKRLRIVSDQQGFAVAGLVVSSARKAAPKDDEWRALEARRPRAWDLLEPHASSGSGYVLREVWRNISGDDVEKLTGHKSFQGPPTEVHKATSLEGPRDWADNYGTRIRGFLIPPVTGSYVFFVCTDDGAELWLSTDDNPENKKRIVQQKGAVGFDVWDQPSQRSPPVRLAQGRRYYFEVLHKEGKDKDHIRVGWKIPDGPEERPIPGARLAPYVPGAAPRVGVSLSSGQPAGNPAAGPVTVPISVEVSGASDVSRIELFQGGQKIGDVRAGAPSFAWSRVSPGCYPLQARVTEKNGRVGFSSPIGVQVGEIYFFRAVNLNGPSESIDRRLWSGRETGGYAATGAGFERLDVDLRPVPEPARARMIRSSVFAREGTRVSLTEVPAGKYQVYLTVWEPRDAPQALEIHVNGKPAGAHSFQAPGEWARLGPWPAEPENGRIEVAAVKGGGFFSGVELWSFAPPPKPTQRVRSERIGGGGGGEWVETRDGDPFLVGIKLMKENRLRWIQPIWEGDVLGREHGGRGGAEVEVKAKPGYAVGGLRLRGGDRVYALRVVFMKIVGPVLNPADSYESDWILGNEADTKLLGGDGSPVVGLHGRAGGDVDSLGIIQLK